MKKAQGMSLNVIIIAALVVLVLIVLAVIFIRNSERFNINVGSCEAKGGVCGMECGDIVYNTEGYNLHYLDARCPNQQKCCMKIGE
jgi:hypothetical protein